MITIENHIGKIKISDRYLRELIWNTVTDCFGVVDLNARSVFEDIKTHLFRDPNYGNGVSIKVKDNSLVISIHISVTFGTNIAAVVKSMKHKVRYAVEEAAGVKVSQIHVSVDSMRN